MTYAGHRCGWHTFGERRTELHRTCGLASSRTTPAPCSCMQSGTGSYGRHDDRHMTMRHATALAVVRCKRNDSANGRPRNEALHDTRASAVAARKASMAPQPTFKLLTHIKVSYILSAYLSAGKITTLCAKLLCTATLETAIDAEDTIRRSRVAAQCSSPRQSAGGRCVRCSRGRRAPRRQRGKRVLNCLGRQARIHL